MTDLLRQVEIGWILTVRLFLCMYTSTQRTDFLDICLKILRFIIFVCTSSLKTSLICCCCFFENEKNNLLEWFFLLLLIHMNQWSGIERVVRGVSVGLLYTGPYLPVPAVLTLFDSLVFLGSETPNKTPQVYLIAMTLSHLLLLFYSRLIPTGKYEMVLLISNCLLSLRKPLKVLSHWTNPKLFNEYVTIPSTKPLFHLTDSVSIQSSNPLLLFPT